MNSTTGNIKIELIPCFLEMEYHLLNDKNPSDYLNNKSMEPVFNEYPFRILKNLKHIEQSPKYHPEGNVWIHTMLVVEEAAKERSRSKDAKVFMWAALLHDIGKLTTTKMRNGRLTSYNHDKAGAELCKEFLACYTDDHNFILQVSNLILHHMQILYITNQHSFSNIKKMKEEINIEELSLLGLADRMGRLNSSRKKEEDTIRQFLKKCK